MGREFEMTNITVFDFDGFSTRDRLFVCDREVFNDVCTDITLRLENVSIWLL